MQLSNPNSICSKCMSVDLSTRFKSRSTQDHGGRSSVRGEGPCASLTDWLRPADPADRRLNSLRPSGHAGEPVIVGSGQVTGDVVDPHLHGPAAATADSTGGDQAG